MERFSPLQQARLAEPVPLPRVLSGGEHRLSEGAVIPPPEPQFSERIRALFPNTFAKPSLTVEQAPAGSAPSAHKPLKVGIVLSGGQAPGGHNVLAGMLDGLKKLNSESTLTGFTGGPKGLLVDSYVQVDEAFIAEYRNMGGFDSIFSGRDKIETQEDLLKCLDTLKRHNLDALVIAGGDDSNTNAALIAEFVEQQALSAAPGGGGGAVYRCRCIGIPKTIDGDLKVPTVGLDTSFGFDTACKVYAEQVASIAFDNLSSNKYYSLIRVMGRAASNIALEIALQTHPNVCLIGEEVAALHKDLSTIVEELVDVIVHRAETGTNHGVIVIPEGLIEFVPEIGSLLRELNDLLASGVAADIATVADALGPNNAALFRYLPSNIQKQLLGERDPHGNVQVSLIQTEDLLSTLVAHELERLKRQGKYKGTYQAQTFFCGYEGRSGLPSPFDAAYCYALGYNGAVLIDGGANAVMSVVSNLSAPVEDWTCAAVPLTSLLTIERRKGKDKAVIKKWLVDLKGAPFRHFVERRAVWALQDSYRNPGPIQFHRSSSSGKGQTGANVGPLTFTLALEIEEKKAVAAGGGGGLGSPALHISAAGAGGEAAADGSAGTADLTGYQFLLEGILETGLESVSAKDLKRLTLFRVAHGIRDSDHYKVLMERFGVSRHAWREQLGRLHVAAGAGSPAVA